MRSSPWEPVKSPQEEFKEDIEQKAPPKQFKELTPMQEAVLFDLWRGLMPSAIAEKRCMTLRNVYTHIKRAKKKGFIAMPVKRGVRVVGYELYREKKEDAEIL